MQEYTEKVVGIFTAISYYISGTLLIGDWLSILDDHAAAFGVIGGALTLMINIIFQWMNHKAIRDKK